MEFVPDRSEVGPTAARPVQNLRIAISLYQSMIDLFLGSIKDEVCVLMAYENDKDGFESNLGFVIRLTGWPLKSPPNSSWHLAAVLQW